MKAEDAVSESPSLVRGGVTPTSPIEAKPVERAVEARPMDDGLGSMVRCLAFARTYIISGMCFLNSFTLYLVCDILSFS